MIRKSILITILTISLMGCDDDFRQGSCEEGFYEQSDGNGGFFCAPITTEGVADQPTNDFENLNKSDLDI